MPRNNGVYTLPPIYFAENGETIEPNQHNVPLEDVASALTGSLARDGSSPMLGNLPMNGRRITNLAAGTAAGDAVRLDQVSGYLKRDGSDPMTGDLVMGSKRITGLGVATDPNDAISLSQAVPRAGANDLGPFSSNLRALGNLSGTTIALTMTGSNFISGTNNGNFTISAPAAMQATFAILVTNAATGAGTMTPSGFSKVNGIFKTDANLKQLIAVTAIAGTSLMHIQDAS